MPEQPIDRTHKTVTIANGASLSDAEDVRGLLLVGITMPAAWTAADLSFQASADGTTYNDAYDADGNELVVQAAASRYIAIGDMAFQGVAYIKVRSGTTGAAQAQGAARLVTLHLRRAA